MSFTSSIYFTPDCPKCTGPFRLESPLDNVDYISLSRRSNTLEPIESTTDKLAKAKRDIAALDLAVRELQGRIRTLQEQRRGIEQQKSNYSALLSTTRKLPNDVLSFIFSFACLEGTVITDDVATRSRFPALILSQVSYRWRNLLNSVPPVHRSLWTSINLELTDPDRSSATLQRIDNAVQYVLAKALSGSDTSTIAVVIAPLPVRRLFREVNRWREAELYVHQRYFTYNNWPVASPTNLRRLVLHLTGAIPEDLDAPPMTEDIIVFRNAYNLVELDFQDCDYGVNTTLFKFRWRVLQKLSLSGALLDQIFRILPKLQPKLHFLKLDVVDGRYQKGPPVREGVIDLKNLRTLELGCHCWYSAVYQSLFDAFTAPSLTSLSLSGPDVPRRPIKELESPSACILGPSFVRFLARSASQLKSLSIRSVIANETTLLASMIYLSSLTSLRIEQGQGQEQQFPNISRSFISTLIVKQDGSGPLLLPKLEDFELAMTGDKFALSYIMVEFYRSRRAPLQESSLVTTLKRVQFNYVDLLSFMYVFCLYIDDYKGLKHIYAILSEKNPRYLRKPANQDM